MSRTRVLIAGLLAFGAVIAIAQPASASTGSFSGSSYTGGVLYQNTARTNTYQRSQVLFNDSDNAGGVEFAMAIRPGVATSGTFARATGPEGTWTALKDDATGLPYVSPGTFYTSTEIVASACGGSGCGLISWTLSIQWSIPY